ncbi:MAG TPA: hypothetical protein DD670_15920 [Planctomycetaceae bacterium]|nr:hypothetical protein [Planctomycetaceae bacterium]
MNEPIAREVSAESRPSRRKCFRPVRILVLVLVAWLVAAYFLLPLAWRFATRHHPALADTPCVAVTRNGIPGDPLNIALVGTEEEIVGAMLDAEWYPADPITVKSSLRIAEATIRRRSYDTAPVSDLYVWGRKQDLAFQQPIGMDPRRRHHVRFWRSEKRGDRGRPLWAGAATRDTSVGLSHTTGQITHHIDADVDAERDKLLDDLTRHHLLVDIDWIDGFHTKLEGRNGGSDRWYTDGRLPIATVKRSEAAPGPADREKHESGAIISFSS